MASLFHSLAARHARNHAGPRRDVPEAAHPVRDARAPRGQKNGSRRLRDESSAGERYHDESGAAERHHDESGAAERHHNNRRLPLDAPLKATAELDFAEALQPCIKEGKEADVAELTAALTSARKMVQWALDKDRSMVSVDELVSRVRAHRDRAEINGPP